MGTGRSEEADAGVQVTGGGCLTCPPRLCGLSCPLVASGLQGVGDTEAGVSVWDLSHLI